MLWVVHLRALHHPNLIQTANVKNSSQRQKAIKGGLRKAWGNCQKYIHSTHNIRSSSSREIMFSDSPLVFSTVDFGYMNSFTAANVHKLFEHQHGETDWGFPYVFSSHTPILLGRISGVWINHLLLFLLTVMYFTQVPDACHNGQSAVLCQAVGKAEAQVVENTVSVITLSLQGVKATPWPAHLRHKTLQHNYTSKASLVIFRSELTEPNMTLLQLFF